MIFCSVCVVFVLLLLCCFVSSDLILLVFCFDSVCVLVSLALLFCRLVLNLFGYDALFHMPAFTALAFLYVAD